MSVVSGFLLSLQLLLPLKSAVPLPVPRAGSHSANTLQGLGTYVWRVPSALLIVAGKSIHLQSQAYVQFLGSCPCALSAGAPEGTGSPACVHGNTPDPYPAVVAPTVFGLQHFPAWKANLGEASRTQLRSSCLRCSLLWQRPDAIGTAQRPPGLSQAVGDGEGMKNAKPRSCAQHPLGSGRGAWLGRNGHKSNCTPQVWRDGMPPLASRGSPPAVVAGGSEGQVSSVDGDGLRGWLSLPLLFQ